MPSMTMCGSVKEEDKSKEEYITDQCKHLDLPFDEQLNAVLTPEMLLEISNDHERPLAWTVIDRAYADFAGDWHSQLMAVNLSFQLYVSIDDSPLVAKELCARGFTTVSYAAEFGHQDASKEGEVITWTTKYRVAKAKFTIPVLLQQRKISSLFAESDVFWLRDPLPQLRADPHANFVSGAHANNPWSINIGMWYIPSSAPPDISRIFTKAWETMKGNFSEVSSSNPFALMMANKNKPLLRRVSLSSTASFTRFDDVEQHSARPRRDDAHDADDDLAFNKFDQMIDERFKLFDQAVLQQLLADTNQFPNLKVRVLSNAVFVSSNMPSIDSDTIGVHILANVPLSDAGGKLASAKVAGAFVGNAEYYETRPSKVRYLGWDGHLTLPTLDQHYDKYPYQTANPEVVHNTLQLLFTLGLAFKRSVVLPTVVDIATNEWNAEALFDVSRFQKDNKKLGLMLDIRESTYFRNRHLKPVNLYPLARFRVEVFNKSTSWVGIEITKQEGETPESFYWKADVPDSYESYASILVDLMHWERIADMKTILIKFPAGGQNDHSLDFRGDCGDAAQQQLLSSDYFCKQMKEAAARSDMCRTSESEPLVGKPVRKTTF